jgi:sugar phosphate isomerase/epimerase
MGKQGMTVRSRPRHSIFLGTVLLEANRWAKDRSPTYRVSEWLERIAAAGFDGIELWENHAVMADAGEREALRASPVPVAVFNSYVSLDASGENRRLAVARQVRDLKAGGVKFNVSASSETLESELRAARAWAALMPRGVDLLCECHPGTAMEDPAVAARALSAYPEIGVIVHPFSCHDLAAWVKHLGPRLRHAHAQVVDAEWHRWRLCDRPQLVRARLALLREAGYAGTFTIEFTAGVGVAPENREALFEAACEDLAFLREAWQDTGA